MFDIFLSYILDIYLICSLEPLNWSCSYEYLQSTFRTNLMKSLPLQTSLFSILYLMLGFRGVQYTALLTWSPGITLAARFVIRFVTDKFCVGGGGAKSNISTFLNLHWPGSQVQSEFSVGHVLRPRCLLVNEDGFNGLFNNDISVLFTWHFEILCTTGVLKEKKVVFAIKIFCLITKTRIDRVVSDKWAQHD